MGSSMNPRRPAPRSVCRGPRRKFCLTCPKLRAALVKPYQLRFVLRDTPAELRAASRVIAEYWVVAQTDDYIEFFDPLSKEFGPRQTFCGRRGACHYRRERRSGRGLLCNVEKRRASRLTSSCSGR